MYQSAAGDRRAFFVTLNNLKKGMYCTATNDAMFDVATRNDVLQILVGAGMRYGFANAYDGYVWNGSLFYTATDGDDDGASSQSQLQLVEDALEIYNRNHKNQQEEEGAVHVDMMDTSSSSSSNNGSSLLLRAGLMSMSAVLLLCLYGW